MRTLNNTDPYLGKPIRSLQSMLRLLAQEDSDLLSVIPDGIYGKSTLHSVSSFQKKYGLPVTGVVNEATWQCIADAYTQALIRQGPANPLLIYLGPGQIMDEANPTEHIWLIQSMLHVLSEHFQNIPQVIVTGSNDKQTQAAVSALKKYAGLDDISGGNVDKKTWKYLTDLYRSVTADNANVIQMTSITIKNDLK